jgi:hypothetical protein
MPHYYLEEGFENNWKLIRETEASQKFRVTTPEKYEFAIDIHYTSPKVLTVNVVFVGDENTLSESILRPVFNELGRIALKRSDYAVIDYTLAHTKRLHDGNFSIDEKDRKFRKL